MHAVTRVWRLRVQNGCGSTAQCARYQDEVTIASRGCDGMGWDVGLCGVEKTLIALLCYASC
jgi:hypothetical protein